MKGRNIRTVICAGGAWLLLATLTSWAQESTRPLDQYTHRVWTASNGLPQQTIYDVLQTRDGYIWLGTTEGAVRFDGRRFVLFDDSAIPRLTSSHAVKLLEASDGGLWIAFYGPGGGLVRYADGKFESNTAADGVVDTSFTALAEDRQGDLWIGTEHGLIVGHRGHFSAFAYDIRLGNNIVDVVVAPDGAVWVATEKSIFSIRPGTELTNEFGAHIPGPRSLYFDHLGALWIGTDHGAVYSVRAGQITRHSGGHSHDAPVTAIHEDRDGVLWIGTLGSGVCRLQSHFECYSERNGLSSNDVLSVYGDREGSLWVGTTLAGLNRLNAGVFRIYGAKDAESDNVWMVQPGGDSTVWAGTNAGLELLKNGTETKYNFGEAVTAVEESSNATLWVGTAHGLKQLRHGVVTHLYSTRDGLASDKINALHQDRKRSLWIGTIAGQGGLTRLSKGVFTVFTSKDGLASTRVHTIVEDHTGALWLGTSVGVTRFQEGTFTNYAVRRKSDGEASHVNCIYEDSAGDLWMGTYGAGLARMHEGSITLYTKADGLFDDTIWSVLEDDSGSLWMTSNRGLFRVRKDDLDNFSRQKLKLIPHISYGIEDGLPTTEFDGGLQSAAARTPDGKMFFASIKGIVEFDRRRLSYNPVPPPIVIEQAMLNHRLITNDTARMADGGSLDFSFVALSFLAPEKVVYKYKLEGFDKDWIVAGRRNVAYYTNLPPGDYRFRVAGSNNDGVWSTQEATFGLFLKPHFYQTVFFRILCGFIIIAVPFGITALRQRAQKAMERKLEELIQQRSLELIRAKEVAEATAATKSRLLTNISHELRTPVNGLLGMIELMRQGGLTREQLDLSDAATFSGNALLNVLNEILDYSALEAHKMQLKLEEFELSKTIASLRQTFVPLAQNKKIELAFHLSSDIPARITGDPARFFEILMNLVGNAFKFTEAGEVSITADVIRRSNLEIELQVCVADTGIGIPPDEQKRILEPFRQVDSSLSRKYSGTGLGLAIVSGLVALMGGRLWLESELGKGTKVFFTLLLGLPALPNVQSGRSQVASAGTTDHPIQASGLPLHILVVEDNLINQKFAVGLLRKHGYEVEVAENGQEALEKMNQISFDLILMDIQMPVMNGIEATLEIRRLEQNGSRHIPIVALTAHASVEDRDRCLQAGMDEYLSKPIAGKDLVATIANVLDRSRGGFGAPAPAPGLVSAGRS